MNISLNNFDGINFQARRKKFGITLLMVLGVSGILFIATGLFFYNEARADVSWTKTQGEVVDVLSRLNGDGTTYTPVVIYEVGGKSYQVTGRSSSGVYPNLGDKREVAYNPALPNQSKIIGDGEGIIFIFIGVGTLFVILALFLSVKSYQRSKDIKNLIRTGQKLQGILTELQLPGGQDSNSGYKIVVSATDSSGTVQNYTSDSLSGVGELTMIDFHKSPVPIDVYVDSTNPQNYYVDIADIPNLTPQKIGELIKSSVASAQPNSTAQTQNPIPTVPPQPFATNESQLPINQPLKK